MRNRILVFVAAAAAALSCSRDEAPTVYQAVPVEFRSIVVSARAAGTVQPDTVVEVKSKASGEILEMRAETGQLVTRGTLLVRVDQRTVRNTFNQAEATLDVVKARLANAESQAKRAEELYKAQGMSQQEYESALLALANAKAEVVRAEVEIENAKISMDDTDVLAPITGTIISKTAERGMVISSPTQDVGGGTVLLRMADLALVQVRTLVDETDIGKIQPGLRATVTVGAYPNQPFTGDVRKIEPQAETLQNVTMFPVIIRIQNRGGLLKPGMNADVEIHIGQRENVMAVPNAALRTQRDVSSAAQVLGIAPERLQTLLADADRRRDSLRTTLASTAPRDSTRGGDPEVNDTAARPSGGRPVMTMPDGREIPLPAGVTEQQVRDLMRKRFQGGELTARESALLQRVTQGFRAGGGGGGRGMGGRGSGPGGPDGGFGGEGFGGRQRPQTNEFQFGGSYIVFVMRNGEPSPVHVQTGLTDLDFSEVVSGLEKTDSVLVLPSASLVQQQQDQRDRVNRMTGGGGLVPGMQQQGTTGQRQGTGGTPPAGGARPGGR